MSRTALVKQFDNYPPGIFSRARDLLNTVQTECNTYLENPEDFFFRVQNLLTKVLFQYVKNANIVKKKRFSLSFFITDLALSLISILSILRARTLGVHIAHYMIDTAASLDKYDARSQAVLSAIPANNTLNFLHINNMRHSIRYAVYKNNPVFFESLCRIFTPFYRLIISGREQRYTYNNNAKLQPIINYHLSEIQDAKIWVRILSHILKWLKVEKFIMLDDGRYTNELVAACKHLSIPSIGYMHNRFNEYHLGIMYFPFSKYLVWSDYFKTKYLSLVPGYDSSNIIVVGHLRLDNLPLNAPGSRIGMNCTTVLWLGETNVDPEELSPFLQYIIQQANFRLLFRGKPGEKTASAMNWLNELDIKRVSDLSFFDTLIKERVDIVLGTHTTALMESWLVGVPSIVLPSSFDYGAHLVNDKLLDICSSPSNLLDIIGKLVALTEAERSTRCDKIWGQTAILRKKVLQQSLLH